MQRPFGKPNFFSTLSTALDPGSGDDARHALPACTLGSFDTFPWPQSPSVARIDAVAEAGRAVRRVRAEALTKIKGGLRAVYRTLELPGKNPLKDAHAALDAAVLSAYGFDPRGDLLAQLLALNLEVSGREQSGQPVTAPGVPPGHPDPARLLTDDCLRAS